MNKPIKPFLTYEQQLYNLQNEKMLIINNPSYALFVLQNIRYYALIDGYKYLFYNPMTRKYLSGTTFEDIVALYYFDESLRELVFKYICRIEQKLRTEISYYFCDKYSSNQMDYLNPDNYNNRKKNVDGISRLIKILDYEANKNKNHDYIVYQRKTYGNVPLWVTVNALTLGQISKMYSFLQSDIQAKISHCYRYVNEKELSQYLKVLTDYRNVCAHNERLFSFRSHTDIPDTGLHQKLRIPLNGSHYIMGKNDMYAVVLSFRYLLSGEDFSCFKRTLNKLFALYRKQSENASMEKLYCAMGFPANWNDVSRYKL